MTDNKDINFIIDHIDPLGQGVYKNDETIYFIPKTLPGESGNAKIYRSKKKIKFAKLEKLNKKSSDRIEPQCEHYKNCNGCHFLHTDYDNEIKIKEIALTRMASFDFDIDKIYVHPAPRRFNYRNRIQLHYDRNLNEIGFINPQTKKIIATPHCLMPQEDLAQSYKEFLKNWQTLAPHRPKGHVELYVKNNKLNITWNERYADSGFTQVFKEMNDKLKELVEAKLDTKDKALDLFGGDGNLSDKLSQKTVIDYYSDMSTDEYKVHLDLYKEKAYEKLDDKLDIDTMIIDPPRKGFPLMDSWVKKYKPKKIIYVSCHSQTMFRDLKAIKSSYSLEELHLLDLFPSTYHFESMAVLKRNKT